MCLMEFKRVRNWFATWKFKSTLLCQVTDDLIHWVLTHWGRVTHICVKKRTIIGSDNGLSPSRRQTIIRTNVGILLIGPSGTIFSEKLIEIHTFSFTKMHLKMSSGKRRLCFLGLNVQTEPDVLFSQSSKYPSEQEHFISWEWCFYYLICICC